MYRIIPMATDKVAEIVENIAQTFDDVYYGGIYDKNKSLDDFDFKEFTMNYFAWLNEDLKRHYIAEFLDELEESTKKAIKDIHEAFNIPYHE